MNRPQQSNAGFTLLELLMVVIIISILTATALPQFFRAVERSRTAQMLPLMASIRGSEYRFKAADPNQLYTKTLTNLDITLPGSPNGWGAVTVDGTAAGSNVVVNRVGGTRDKANLLVDLDTGVVCSDNVDAAADWGIPNSAACP